MRRNNIQNTPVLQDDHVGVTQAPGFLDTNIGKAVLIGGGLLAAGAVFAAMCYRVSKPEEFLVRTGLGITDLAVSRKAFVWPFQTYTYISMKPHTFQFNLHNMSKEKVEFNLPVVFTIGPVSPMDDADGFKRFAQNMSHLELSESEDIIRGVVEGETRGLTANLTVEEMFNSKEKFRSLVVQNIQTDLSAMGLRIYNANIKEMSDYDEHNKYFVYRKQRAIESANYDAQVEVAEARKLGEIGLKQRDKDTRVTVAMLDTEAKIAENQRKAEVATSEAILQEARAIANRRTELANIEASMAARLREAELQREVEVKRQMQTLEQLRADQLSKTRVQAEQSIAEAEGQAAAIRHIADAKFYEEQKQSEAVQFNLESHAAGLQRVMSACNNDASAAKFYLGLKEGIYEKLAEQQAKAVQGMKPNISVWNTGAGASESNPLQPILNTVQSMAPMLDGLHKHTDFRAPDWLVQSAKAASQAGSSSETTKH